MPLEDNFLTAIKGFEGFTPQAKWDAKQYSNGYGTKALHPGEVIDQPTADQRFGTEIGKASDYVSQAFPDLEPGRHAALSSLTYNAGPGWIQAGLGDAVRRGDWNDAAARFSQYNKSEGKYNEGLANRRAQEVAWFDQLPGNPVSSPPQPGALSQPPAQGQTKMADQQPPSLSAQFFAGGPGALFGGQSGDQSYDLPHSMQNAAGWLQSLDTKGKSLDMVKPRDDFSVINGPDGSIYQVNKKTGTVRPMTGPLPKVIDGEADFLGNKPRLVQTGDKIQTLADYLKGGGLTPASQTPDGGNLSSMLAPGVPFDAAATGDARIAEFNKHPKLKEFVAPIMNYVHGESMPTGKGDKYTQFIKREAENYGAATGNLVSDTTFAAKRKANMELASAMPGSAGGQAVSGLTTMDHLGEVKDAFDAVHNKDANGVVSYLPFGSAIAHLSNKLDNTFPSKSGPLATLGSKTARYAEESTKQYSGGQPAQAERERVNGLFSPNMQPQESNAVLKSERDLLSDKVGNAIAQLTVTLGANNPKIVDLKHRYDKTVAAIDAKLSAGGVHSGTRPPLTSFGPNAAAGPQRPPLASFAQ